jgi:hypothetical protein
MSNPPGYEDLSYFRKLRVKIYIKFTSLLIDQCQAVVANLGTYSEKVIGWEIRRISQQFADLYAWAFPGDSAGGYQPVGITAIRQTLGAFYNHYGSTTLLPSLRFFTSSGDPSKYIESHLQDQIATSMTNAFIDPISKARDSASLLKNDKVTGKPISVVKNLEMASPILANMSAIPAVQGPLVAAMGDDPVGQNAWMLFLWYRSMYKSVFSHFNKRLIDHNFTDILATLTDDPINFPLAFLDQFDSP